MTSLFASSDAKGKPPGERERGGCRFALVAVERGIERVPVKRQGRPGLEAPSSEGNTASPKSTTSPSAEPTPPAEVDGTLAYRAEDPALALGDRVRVPLGRANKPAEGIVIRLGGAELLDGLDPNRVKGIISRTGVAIAPDLLDLAAWMAKYYVCPLGMVLASMMPAAVKRGAGVRKVEVVSPVSPEQARSVLEGPSSPKLSPALRRAWDAIAARPVSDFPQTPRALETAMREAHEEDATKPKVTRAAIARLVAAGLLIATTQTVLPGSPADAPSLESDAGRSVPQPTSEQQAVIDGIIGTLGRFAVHLIQGVTGSGKTEVYLRAIAECLRRGQRAIVLVPEIALTPQTSGRFIERFARGGAGSSGTVAVLHSGLTANQRHAQWAACAAGHVRVVVGARSAVFAPLAELGLIVVDEEHDGSYKQDQLPRYHARDVAIKRASLNGGCPVVLGSATPSLESYANARGVASRTDGSDSPGTQGGSVAAGASNTGGTRVPPKTGASPAKFTLWTLARRVGGAALPRVEIVDMVEERRARTAGGGWRDHHLHLLGPKLEAALDRTLAEGGQAILLLNKRGYANHICCPDPRCGWVMHCDQCDVTMVFHLAQRFDGSAGVQRSSSPRGVGQRRPGYVRCHHCQAEQMLPKSCPQCDRNINTFGQGTQRVEEELERKFALTRNLRTGDTMLRVDADTMRSAADYFDALDRFARGDVRVLLGTQMIAKGLDFPNVRLVGVVNADTALALPDFRASERTFQLVSQVAGRAGRGKEPGLVIVQTLSPRAPAIVRASRHDFEGFAREELALRARVGLPPAGRMARVVCRHEDHTKALAAALAVHAALAEAIAALGTSAGHTRLRPPVPCAISRIAGQHRFAIELLAQTRGVIQAVLARVRGEGLLKSDARTAVDVDPLALL